MSKSPRRRAIKRRRLIRAQMRRAIIAPDFGGLWCFDPREHRYVITANPALIAASFMRGEAVDWSVVAKAANEADSEITPRA